MIMESNIKNTALIFEGGGMRASYTAGMAVTLLEAQLYFDYVAGISAGSSLSVNYLLRDAQRSRKTFVDLVLEPDFGGWSSFFKGKGFFNADAIYEQMPRPDGPLAFDIEVLKRNPARLKIGAFDQEAGKVVYFSKEELHEPEDVMKVIRASSSLPIWMPPTEFRQRTYWDGGLGGGIALEVAQADGFQRFFVVLTRPRGYRKPPVRFPRLLRAQYFKYPQVATAVIERPRRYNEILDRLEALEKKGQACVVYPDEMPVSSRETDYHKLKASYEAGYAQGQRELPRWQSFLQSGL